LSAPVGLILMPDQTALVGERTTGRILRVQPRPGQPVQTVRTLTGLSTTGDGGLLDLALSPNYAEDNLIFAYVTTPTDNRVVDFTLTGPVTPVLTGIPRGATGNTGRIAFGPDGELFVGTGDAGVPANVDDQHSLAGKILRVTSIGRPAPGNPVAGSPIVLSGPHEVDGLCTDADGTVLLETESRPGAATDLVNELDPGAIRHVGAPPAASRGIGGCAIESGVLYVASRDGHDLLGAPLDTTANIATISKWTSYLVNRYGRLRTVVAAPDGALWLTTSNRDGKGSPVADDERVLRIQPPAQSGASPV
jgi:glucose/arabinose dehydrogenase